jgi:hypothetical protein
MKDALDRGGMDLTTASKLVPARWTDKWAFPIPDEVTMVLDEQVGTVVQPIPQGRLTAEWHGKVFPQTGEIQRPRKMSTGNAEGCLDRFLRLGSGAPEDILEFAQDWGLLDLGEGQPLTPSLFEMPEPGVFSRLRTSGFLNAPQSESLRTWYLASDEARAILLLISQIRREVPTDPDLWGSVLGLGRWATEIASLSADEQAGVLVQALDSWLWYGRMAPRVRWTSAIESPELHWDLLWSVGGLLAWQLVSVATSDRGIAVCTECGNPYEPSRKPNPNRENFCRKCSEGRHLASKRRWARRNRNRNRNPTKAGRDTARSTKRTGDTHE